MLTLLNEKTQKDYEHAFKQAYAPHGLLPENLAVEKEGTEYGACSFTLAEKKVVFRVAKITPTKNGQFVTIWQRAESGIIRPYDTTDRVDFIIISVGKKELLGHFIFPQSVLLLHDCMSRDGKGGKRGMRVYPPWDTPDSMQAKKTQAWQLPYFVAIQPVCDTANIKKCFKFI